MVGKKIIELGPCSDKTLRFAYDLKILKKLHGHKIEAVERRAKYLLFRVGSYFFVSHLGMTGNWRQESLKHWQKKVHDHFYVKLNNEKLLIYNDSRRFGFLFVEKLKDWQDSSFFKHLGPEPLSKGFTSTYLFTKLSTKKAPIKSVIMDQRVVVGVGNIYASESLFMANIHPLTASNQISELQIQKLVRAIKKVLRSSIKAGGSTIKDFKQAGGSEGYFQQKLKVYGKKGQNCVTCGEKIQEINIAGRATYFCGTCQVK